MIYHNTVRGIFIERKNRFIAEVMIGDIKETVHVKNTGRLRELLIPGADVVLEHSEKPGRKTAYDLVMVYKEGLGWVNIDSQAANTIAREWLESGDFDLIRPEYTYGKSRVDFYMEKGEDKYLMEVKGCTLLKDGAGCFPDAPTERGIKHLHELISAVREGYHASIAFVIQMNGVNEVRANNETAPEFGAALEEAGRAGVEVIFIPCRVYEDSVVPDL